MRLANLGGLAVRITGGTDGSGGGDGPLVVLLHGFGAPADDLIPLGEALVGPRSAVRFAFPGAPLTLPGLFGAGRAWWMIDLARYERVAQGDLAQLGDDVPPGMEEARALVVAMLDELESALGVPGERVALGGFSQGAMLACDVALRTGRPLAGLVLMSGMMLCRQEWLRFLPDRRGLRAFQSHGTQDPIVPFVLAAELRDAMRAAGVEVDWVQFPGGHEIPAQVGAGASAFLARVLG